MADVDTNQHGLIRDLRAKLHAPKVTAKFGVHLTDDVKEDSVVVFSNCAVSDELTDNGRVAVYLVFQEGIEVLMVGVVRHDNQEDKLSVLNCTSGSSHHGQNLLIVVVLDGLCKRLKEDFFVVGCLVRDGTDISKFDLDIQAFLSAQVVKLVVDVVGVADIALETEDSETFKHLGLVDHRVEVVAVVQNTRYSTVCLLHWLAGKLVSGGLGVEVW